MNNIIEEISKIGIVPVIALNDAKDAKPLAKALCDGGIACAEVTFRTEAAKESIRIMTNEYPDMLVGAGTVLTTKQVDEAIEAGAKFIVSPGLNPKIVKYCLDKNITILPGTANPSDVEQAIELGLDVVKFFPAEQAGGINMIKAMSAPYNQIKFMPTGGINAANLNDYLSFNKIVACGGSWMVKKDLIENKEFDKIKQLVKEAVKLMLGFSLKHIGINTDDETQAKKIANIFSAILGIDIMDNNISYFVGHGIEVMRTDNRGEKGHIAIGTNFIERAIYYLEKQGFKFDENSKVYKDGQLKLIYFEEEIGGFGVHLSQK